MRTGSRVARRITPQPLRRPWKIDIADELRNAFSSEICGTATEHSPHENRYWDWAHEEAALVVAAEKQGKVARARLGGGCEEDEIRWLLVLTSRSWPSSIARGRLCEAVQIPGLERGGRVFADDWEQLTPDQRFEARMRAWLEPRGVEFADRDARGAYRARVTMLRDAIELRRPARVPVAPSLGLFPAFWGGLSAREAYYEPSRLREVWRRFHREFRPDVLTSSGNLVPCAVFDLLDYRLYDWPGHGVGDQSGYQYNEKEWMRADEYDELIADASYFWQHTYLPRVFHGLEPMRALAPLTDILEAPFTAPFFLPFGDPAVREMLQKLLEAGRLAGEWFAAVGAMDAEVTATLGIPQLDGGATKAPYDILGDTLRGTRGLMMDTFRRRDEVIAACERLVPIAIDAGVRGADATGLPLCFIPLHKGADGFLDDKGFRELYWPTLKAVLLGLIAQGIVPHCFAEGSYDSRLGIVSDPEIPAGRMLWLFDATDMDEVRRDLGGRQCFSGNVPGALFTVGDPAQMDEYVRRLIAHVAGDGGFILGSGVVLDEARPECFKAFVEAGLKYGAEV